MKYRKLVYLSGPITCSNYDRTQAIHAAVEMHRELMRAGYAVVNPMLTAYLPFAFDGTFTHEEWLASDFPVVASADAVFRLPGPSRGADQETELARQFGIPVVTSIRELNYIFGLQAGAA
jgi:hypothetical protein